MTCCLRFSKKGHIFYVTLVPTSVVYCVLNSIVSIILILKKGDTVERLRYDKDNRSIHG